MAKQRISYVPLEKMDAAMRAEMERCAHRVVVDSGGNISASIHPTSSSIGGRIVTQFGNAQ